MWTSREPQLFTASSNHYLASVSTESDCTRKRTNHSRLPDQRVWLYLELYEILLPSWNSLSSLGSLCCILVYSFFVPPGLFFPCQTVKCYCSLELVPQPTSVLEFSLAEYSHPVSQLQLEVFTGIQRLVTAKQQPLVHHSWPLLTRPVFCLTSPWYRLPELLVLLVQNLMQHFVCTVVFSILFLVPTSTLQSRQENREMTSPYLVISK